MTKILQDDTLYATSCGCTSAQAAVNAGKSLTNGSVERGSCDLNSAMSVGRSQQQYPARAS